MTLLPNKHVPTSKSLVGIGAFLLDHLAASVTVSSLWEKTKDDPGVGNYRNFILALDYLYAIGAIEYQHGFLSRSRP